MTRTIDIEETLISQNGQGISIGHMITTIVVDKVTSLRPVQLPSSVRCNDGTPALIQGTAISIGGDQILVAKTINDVKGLLGFNEFNAEFENKVESTTETEYPKKAVNVDGEVVDKDGPDDDRAEPKIIQFPGKEEIK